MNCLADAIPNRTSSLTEETGLQRSGLKLLEVQLDRFKLNLLLKAIMEGESSLTSLSLLGILDLSQLEPEYLLAVFDKLKEFGAFYRYPDEHPQPGLVRTLFEKIAAGTNLKTLRLPRSLSSSDEHAVQSGDSGEAAEPDFNKH